MNEFERAIMTSSCIDCAGIAKVQEAGRILDTPNGPVQVMHNGVRVKAGGYHGDWMAQIIRALQGHHEPQEELVFHHILRLRAPQFADGGAGRFLVLLYVVVFA